MISLTKIDWDQECRLDFLTGKGFRVYQDTFTDKNRDTKTLYGIRSHYFGSDWDDDDAFVERYSCKCRALVGKVFEGETCAICGTDIEFRDVDLNMTGWVILDSHFIIQPIYYQILEQVMKETKNDTLGNLIQPSVEANKEGIFVDIPLTNGDEKKNPFYGIGLDGLYERYDEILDYYWDKKKNRRDLIDVLRAEKRAVFTSCIPVYSSVLRSIGFGGKDAYFFPTIDRKYPVIITKVRGLNRAPLKSRKEFSIRRREIHDRKRMYELQKTVMEIWELTFSEIETKHGHIRQEILGGRVNFSARNVIVPNPELKADELILGYLTVLELYRYEIIKELVRITGQTYQQAASECSAAEVRYNPRIYEIMDYIVKKHAPQVLINRNPTIKYGSMICMYIKEIRPELNEDLTMELPISPLSDMNADFDGDEINILALKLKAKDFDRTFNPRKSMYISRNDGLFNNNTNLVKDQMVGLYQFNNI